MKEKLLYNQTNLYHPHKFSLEVWYNGMQYSIHTLLLCSASCLHMLLHCLHNFCLDLLILNLHLIHASYSKTNTGCSLHLARSYFHTPITTVTVLDSLDMCVYTAPAAKIEI